MHCAILANATLVIGVTQAILVTVGGICAEGVNLAVFADAVIVLWIADPVQAASQADTRVRFVRAEALLHTCGFFALNFMRNTKSVRVAELIRGANPAGELSTQEIARSDTMDLTEDISPTPDDAEAENVVSPPDAVAVEDADDAAELDQHEADVAVQICCLEGASFYFLAAPEDCDAEDQVIAETIDLCDKVCCQLGEKFKFTTAGACAVAEGKQAPADECEVLPIECTTDADCDDGDVCTDDDCKASVCYNKPLTGVPCDDGDDCTVNDSCQAGFCVGGEVKLECQPDVCCDLGILLGALLIKESECAEQGGGEYPAEKCAEACCFAADEFKLLPQIECEWNGELKDAQDCEDICCELADMQYAWKKSGACPKMVDAFFCEYGTVCCDAGNGPEMLPVEQCNPGTGTPLPIGDCGDVCCELGDEATVETGPKCEEFGGKQLVKDMCDPICCKVGELTADIQQIICEKLGEDTTPENCLEICCPWDDGQYFYQSLGDCPVEPVDPSNCEDNEVCCDLGFGPLKLPASGCKATEGAALLPAQECGPICCVGDKDSTVMEADTCLAANGGILAEEYCESVCCLVAGLHMTLPFVDCMDSGEPAPNEDCEQICCSGELTAVVISAGDCKDGVVWPPESCKWVCCKEVDEAVMQKDALCGENLPWSECPGQCGVASDCGPPQCVENNTAVAGFDCVDNECESGAQVPCVDPQKCLNGACTDVIDPEFVVGGQCNSNNVKFPPDQDWDALKAIRLTISWNTISCCATTGCGFFDPQVGPHPCDFPILISSGSKKLNVDVSGWKQNVGDSYVFELGDKSVSGKYTDGWCGDNHNYDEEWADVPSLTKFIVTAFEDVCCKFPNKQFGYAPASKCNQSVALSACSASVCCQTAAGPAMMPAIKCFDQGQEPAPATECGGTVCCLDEGGLFAAVKPAEDCNQEGQYALPEGACSSGCCKTDEGYETMKNYLCYDLGVPAPDDMCAQVCCVNPNWSGEAEVDSSGDCSEKDWWTYQNQSDCDIVCCKNPGKTAPFFKAGCDKVVSWDNCPGKCAQAEDCGPLKSCSIVDPKEVLTNKCENNNCETYGTLCPDNQICQGGACVPQ